MNIRQWNFLSDIGLPHERLRADGVPASIRLAWAALDSGEAPRPSKAQRDEWAALIASLGLEPGSYVNGKKGTKNKVHSEFMKAHWAKRRAKQKES